MNNTCKTCVYFAYTNYIIGYGECQIAHCTPKKEAACACKFYKPIQREDEE